MTRKLYWFAPHQTPYNDYLFRHVAKAIDGFEVIYRVAFLTSHPWKTPLGKGYRHRSYQTFLGLDWNVALLPLTDGKAFFIIAGWNTGTLVMVITLLRLLGRDYALWTDTPNMRRRGFAAKEWLRSRWLRWVFRGASRVLGTGRPAVDNLRLMGAPDASLEVFPFVVDLQGYKRKPWSPRTEGPIRFISSGRVENYLKGHDVAVRAFAKAAARSSRQFEYTIAGTGPDVERVKALAAELGLSDRVNCAGWVEPETLRDRMKHADVLVHPSPVPDPFPNAVLEGMAAGMTVLGSDVCGSVIDRIEHGVNGLIHRAGNEDQLAEHIQACLENPGTLEEFGKRAEKVAAQWPVERAVRIICNLHKGIS